MDNPMNIEKFIPGDLDNLRQLVPKVTCMRRLLQLLSCLVRNIQSLLQLLNPLTGLRQGLPLTGDRVVEANQLQ